MESDSLSVNLADPDDVRAKLPVAERILRQKQKQLHDYRAAVELWQGHVEYMARVAGVSREEPSPTAETRTASDTSPAELAVDVVLREVRKIRSRDVADALRSEGHDVSNTTVSNALYYAASERGGKRIKQVQRGWYAPLDYADQPITDYEAAGELGFPVPEQASSSEGNQE